MTEVNAPTRCEADGTNLEGLREKKTESNRRFNGLNHEDKENQTMSTPGAFLADIKEIRHRARQHLTEGAVTQNYGGKVEDAIALLNHAVATEIVCVLRYKFHAVCATGLASEAVKEEFAQHANDMHDLPVSHEGQPMLEK